MLVAAALVTSAGACGDRGGPDEPLPVPSEAGAAPLPADATRTGVEATFAAPTWLDSDGEECFLVYRLHPSGLAESDYRCADELDSIIGIDDEISGDDEVGDYGVLDGRVWVRTVWWDEISQEEVLTERTGLMCGGQLIFEPAPNSSPYLRMTPFDLIDGTAPTEDAAPALCADLNPPT